MKILLTSLLLLFYSCVYALSVDNSNAWQMISQHNDPYEFNTVRYGLGITNASKKKKYGFIYGEHHWQSLYIMQYFMPFSGIAIDTAQNLFFYTGLKAQARYNQQFIAGLSFAPTLYKRGHKKDLGNTVQFRSALEFSYQFENKTQIGLELLHFSNGGLSNLNPGSEALSLTYTIPY